MLQRTGLIEAIAIVQLLSTHAVRQLTADQEATGVLLTPAFACARLRPSARPSLSNSSVSLSLSLSLCVQLVAVANANKLHHVGTRRQTNQSGGWTRALTRAVRNECVCAWGNTSYLEHAAENIQEVDEEIQAVRDMVSIALFVAAATITRNVFYVKMCCPAKSTRHLPEERGNSRRLLELRWASCCGALPGDGDLCVVCNVPGEE